MKKAATLILLILTLASAANAVLISRTTLQDGVNPGEYSLVMCEREKQLGAVHGNDRRLCCINKDLNGFCGNNEPYVGECNSNLCIWPTKTLRSSYTYWYKRTPCQGLAILAGDEHKDLLTRARCEKIGTYWCCDPFSFAPHESGLVARPGDKPPSQPNPKGALLVVNPARWRALELGYPTRDEYLKRAYSAEQNRCANGGDSVRIIDPKYGSFFADIKNVKEGWRAFYMMPPDKVTALLAWC